MSTANNLPAGVEESIKTYKLLEGISACESLITALRANDRAAVDDALQLYAATQKRQSSEKGRPSMSSTGDATTPLHLAVQCAPTSMVEYIVSQGKVDLSAKSKQGNTALHLVASQGREDVVEILLQHPDIDDSLANHEGKQVINHTDSC
jgi:oxysterol-binding protein 1